MNRIIGRALTGVLVMCAVSSASTLVTFASWTENGAGGNLFEFNSTTDTFQTGTGASATSIPIVFTFQAIDAGLPPALQVPILAHLTISAPQAGGAASAFGLVAQPVGGTITITADTPVAGIDHNPSDDILLQATFGASVGILGQNHSRGASLVVDSGTGDVVLFSSDYLTFPVGEQEISMDFLTVTPCLTRSTNASPCTTDSGLSTYLRQFTATANGSFSADDPVGFVPEPSTITLIGLAFAGLVAYRRRVA